MTKPHCPQTSSPSTSSTIRQWLRLLGALAAVAFLAAAWSASAQSADTWVGNSDANLGTGANWFSTTAPVTGDSLVFGASGTAGATLTDNLTTGAGSWTFTSLTFTAAAPAYSITGTGGFTLGSGTASTVLIDKSSSSLTINDPITLGNAAQTIALNTGNLTLSGVVASTSGGLTLNSSGGTLVLNNNNTYGGNTTIAGGTLEEDFTAGATTIIPSTSGLTMNGGTLLINGSSSAASSQSFASLTLLPGYSVISAAPASGANFPTVTFNGVLVSNAGCAVMLSGPAYSAVPSSTTGTTTWTPTAATATIQTAWSGGTNLGTASEGGIIAPPGPVANGIYGNAGVFATVGLYDWASTDTSAGAAGTPPYTIVGGSQVSGFYTQTATGSTWANYDMISTANPKFGNGIMNSLRFNQPLANTLNLAATTFQCQGILVTPNMGANNATMNGTSTGSGGGIEWYRGNGGTGDSAGVVFQNNTQGYLVFNCEMSDGKSTHAPCSYVQAGLGTCEFLQPQFLSGNYYLDAGVTLINNYGEIGWSNGVASTQTNISAVNLLGGTLCANASFTLDMNSAKTQPNPILVGLPFGGLAATAGNKMTIDGVVQNPVSMRVDGSTIAAAANPGPLVIGIQPNSANGNTPGLIPGSGAGTANATALYATGTIALTGVNTYTGNTIVTNATLSIPAATALGSSQNLYLNGSSATPATLAATANTTLSLAGGIFLGSGTVAFNAASGTTLTLNNNITSTGPLKISGGGTVSIPTSTATISGSLSVNGTLSLGASASSVTSQSITIASGSQLNVASTSAAGVTIGAGGAFAAAQPSAATADLVGSLTLNGGVLTNNGAIGTNVISGDLTLNGGTIYLNLSPSPSGGSDNVALLGSANLNVTAPTVIEVSFASLGNGTYHLISGASSVTGGNNLSLVLSQTLYGGIISTNLSVTASGADFVVETYPPHNITWLGGVDANSWDNLTSDTDWTNISALTTDYFAANDIVNFDSNGIANPPIINDVVSPGSVTISGPVNYTFSGPGYIATGSLTNDTSTGTTTIETPNAYTGGTTIKSGTLAVGTGGALGAGPVVNNGALVFTRSDSSTEPGLISGSGTVTVSGGGTETFGAANTYSGNTTISGATVKLGVANAIPGGLGAGNVTDNGTIRLNANNLLINALSGSGVVDNTVAVTSPVLTVNSNDTSSTFSGSITNTAGTVSLVKVGAGTLTLAATNGYSGSTTVSQGTLAIGVTNAIPPGTSLTLGSALNSGTLDVAGLSQQVGLLNIGAGGALITNSSTLPGAFVMSAGTTIFPPGSIMDNSVNGGTLAVTLGGTATLSGVNSFAGGLNINNGTTYLQNPQALGSGTVTLTGTTTLVLGGPTSYTVLNPIALGASGGTEYINITNGQGAVTLSGGMNQLGASNSDQLRFTGSSTNIITLAGTWNFPTNYYLIICDGPQVVVGPGANLTLSQSNVWVGHSATGSSFTVNGGTVNGAVSGIVVGQVDGGSNVINSGTEVFQYLSAGTSGGAIYLNGGTLQASNISMPGTFTANGGTLEPMGPNTAYWTNGGTDKIAGGLIFNDLGYNVTIGAAFITGVASGNDGGLTKNGSGELSLTGASTYTGPTTVNAGTLYLNGGTISASTAFTVAANATLSAGTFALGAGQSLSGAGTVEAGTTIGAGAVLAPNTNNNSTVAFVVKGNLTLQGTTFLKVDKGESQTSDIIASGGNSVTFGGTLDLLNIGPALVEGDSITISTNALEYQGGFSSIVTTPALSPGLVWNTTHLTDGLYTDINGNPLAVLVVDALPSISVSPSSTNAECTSTVVFTASASGTPPLTYQWYGNQSNLLAGETALTLTINNVSSATNGSYTIVAHNGDGNTPAQAILSVTDSIPPVISFTDTSLSSGSFVTNECSQSGTFTPPAATALDACSGSETVNTLGVDSVLEGTPGNYMITYTAADAAGNSATNYINVVVQDTTAPVISFDDNSLSNGGSYTVSCSTSASFTPPGVTAADACAASGITINTLGAAGVDLTTLGTYLLTYTATDPSLNTSTSYLNVVVGDTAPPVIVFNDITLSSGSYITNECSKVGVFTPPGITASDTCSPTVSLSTNFNVNEDGVGAYVVTYTATAPSGQTASAYINVVVQDTTAPVISFVDINLSNGSIVTNECDASAGFNPPAVTASDSCAASLTVSTLNGVNNGLPGTYAVTYTATDPSLNSSMAVISVVVQDTLAPVISFVDTSLSSGSTVTNECNATNAFTAPAATGNDACAGIVSVTTLNGVNNDLTGNYIVTYTATDLSGNTATATINVVVQDTTPPVITINSANPTTTDQAQPFTAPSATAADACSGTESVTSTDNVNTNVPGTYYVTYSSTDQANNTGTSVLTVQVLSGEPTIVTDPSATTTANAGTSPVLSVVAQSALSLTYQWYFDATNTLTNNATYSGATTANLTIANVLHADQGTYSVTVTSPLSVSNSTAAILIVKDPYVTLPANTDYTYVGASAVVLAPTNVAGTSTALGYQWYKSTTALQGVTAKGSSLSITPGAALAGTNVYTLVVTNKYGTSTSAVQSLVVFTPVKVTGISAAPGASVLQGNIITLAAAINATASKPVTYQWSRGATVLTGATASTLMVTNLQSGVNDGVYTCTAQNPAVTLGHAAASSANSASLVARPEISKPTVGTIMPATGANLTNANFYMYASLVDSGLITNVTIQQIAPASALQTVTGSLYLKTPGSGYFSNALTLAVGTNVYNVWAVNSAGKTSTVHSVTLFYVTTSALAVDSIGTGTGTIKSGDGLVYQGKYGSATNTALLQVDRSYHITATANAGNYFVNWQSNGVVVTTSTNYGFEMQPGLILKATFNTNAILASSTGGIYNGLFYQTNTDGSPAMDEVTAGAIENLIITAPSTRAGASATFSGSLYLSGVIKPLMGTLDESGAGSAVVTVDTVPGGVLVTLKVDTNIPSSLTITGTVSPTNGGWTSTIALAKTNNSQSVGAGSYTVAVPPVVDGPQGYGVATLTVTAAGKATLSGSLADGTTINQVGMAVGSQGWLPVYQGIYGSARTHGLLEGWIVMTNATPAGELSWVVPASAEVAPSAYTSGFTNANFDLTIEQYTGTTNLVTLTNLTIDEAGLGNAVTLNNLVSVTGGTTFTNLTTKGNKIVDTVSSGNVAFTFQKFPGSATIKSGKGIVLEDAPVIEGYWLAPDGTSQPITVTAH